MEASIHSSAFDSGDTSQDEEIAIEEAPAYSKYVIGLYGVSGVGKSSLLDKLNNYQPPYPLYDFAFREGSSILNDVIPGGLEKLKDRSAEEQKLFREKAIEKIVELGQTSALHTVIAGHYMLWNDPTKDEGEIIGTDADWGVYTHIIYVRGDPASIKERRDKDQIKDRTKLTEEHLRIWQEREIKELRNTCRERNILFAVVEEDPNGTPIFDRVVSLLTVFTKDYHQYYTIRALMKSDPYPVETVLDRVVSDISVRGNFGTHILLDADRTLAPQDTGKLFWAVVKEKYGKTGKDPLREIFEVHNYNYFAFRQVSLLYDEYASDFDAICTEVATRVSPYPEIIALLKGTESYLKKHCVSATIVTCGLGEVWRKVLERNGINEVNVIGNGHASEVDPWDKKSILVTPSVKGELVDKLHSRFHRVIAFGDSPLDLEMLKKADVACVVVGKEEDRSRSMDPALEAAVFQGGLEAYQIILPPGEKPRLNHYKLPLLILDDREIHRLLQPFVITATDKKATLLLQTPTRNADVTGPRLRKAHKRIGFYLATEYISRVAGLASYKIKDVKSGETDGYRLLDESETLIVPLMRGGEPMAFGVSEAFPEAKFLHASEPSDLKTKLLASTRRIILVDSVINSGATIASFLKVIRDDDDWDGEVIVVAGVVQVNALKQSEMANLMRRYKGVSLVALRVSERKYTGQGTSDTGNRLFNTTELD
ncbi:unnamed protein product [Periconia digitata]|uniref:Phosphoribosyltransferase domain-containing protein n=1 Tax=Periconia digitata TaxID=1303443 RepID=A0A9W4XSA6_9PLEO|nr:unnamed protein product [Periconia digitata]